MGFAKSTCYPFVSCPPSARYDASNRVTIHEAKARLSELIQAALAGEEVVIADSDGSLAKLVALPRGPYRLGGLEGRLSLPPDDFFSPCGEHELAEWK